MQNKLMLIIAAQNAHFIAMIKEFNIILSHQGVINQILPKVKSKTKHARRTKGKQNLSTHPKTIRHSIKQPALKWANKISVAKKRTLDAAKTKQR